MTTRYPLPLGTSFFVLLSFGVAIASEAKAQEPSTYRIDKVDAIASEPFSLIKGVREMSDGRVIVTDWIEERLVVVDFESGSTRDLGRVGGGPAEFRLPERLVALPADSTLLIDYGNARLMVLDSQLSFVRTMSTRAHGETYAMSPRAADERGVLYFLLSPWAGGPRGGPSDSVAIGRWAPGFDGVDLVADILVKAYTSRPAGPSTGIPYVPFSNQDGWALSSDGWLAVVRSEPYRVEWYGPGGEGVIGSPIDYDRFPVTMEDRRNHVRDFLIGTAVAGRGEDGGMGHVPADAQSSAEVNRIARDALFADEFPPFVPGMVFASSDGLLWVQRSLPADSVPTFDVLGRSGVRMAVVTLPVGRRVIGFGDGTLYATVANEDDLLTLERYRTVPLASQPH